MPNQKDKKKLSLDPGGGAREHADKKAVRAIERSVEYSYLLRINRRDMLDYQHLCKQMGESPPARIRRFIVSELAQHGLRDSTDK